MADRQAAADQGRRTKPEFYEQKEAKGKDGLGSFPSAKTAQQSLSDKGRRSKGDAC
jgi:hypothetical protein